MNTDKITTDDKKKGQQSLKNEENKSTFDFAFVGSNPDTVSKVVKALGSVDLNAPDADKNASSISDNNGGRIDLNEDDEDIIKK